MFKVHKVYKFDGEFENGNFKGGKVYKMGKLIFEGPAKRGKG